jgi:two-component system NtrC family sensor kinase
MSLQDVNGLISEALSLCRYQLRIDSIEVSLALAENLPEVRIDPREMQQVFLHLVTNAHQALLAVDGRERTLTIRTDRDNDTIRCIFSDNGPGIPPEQLSRIFVPFYTTTKQGDRPGLGLSVAYGIVNEHGGDLLVDSAPGKGTTFTILLPVAG